MIITTRTNAKNRDFLKLVKLLDAELAIRDGEDHGFYDQFNKVELINCVVVGYGDGIPLACGAMKIVDPRTMEIKRMYVIPASRGKGIAIKILSELEDWAKELAYEKCILETGKRQPEAIKLYLKSGYKRIANYGQYSEVENSLCFEKEIIINSEK
jgi:putative acetyltransferase